ncbi:MAG: NAD(P)/FAD-dependent oxidoreductase [Caldilineaceae bacterium]
MSIPLMSDVIVIGGGPAGSTAATFLAKYGYKVTVFEKAKFPREHVGESLLPFCFHLFKELGVLDEMKKHFTRKSAVRFALPDGSSATNWCFNHVIKDESFLSFHVDRPTFDKLLLDNARSNGATVHEETKVSKVDFDTDKNPNLVTVTTSSKNGEEQTHQARFLIDASGRDSFVATSNHWRKPNKGFERTALWTHWEAVPELKGGLEEGSSVIVYLGGKKRGWTWVFPLGLDRVTVGVVMDSFYLREEKAKLTQKGVENWIEALYRQELQESPYLVDLLAKAKIAMPVMIEGDYSYYSEQKYGNLFALVGDAGRFIDPIFSSGIFLSMKSAMLMANALRTMLASPGQMDNKPIVDVYKQIDGAYDLVYRLISLFYNPHALSFAEAGMAFMTEHNEHQDAMSAGHFILSGDFFENHERYRIFMDTLANPTQFERYRHLVINRRNFKTESCDVDRSILFPVRQAVMES